MRQPETPWSARGYPIDERSTHLDAYRLVGIFCASDFVSAGGDLDWLPLKHEFERSEACRILVSLAATSRNEIDLGEEESTFGRRTIDLEVGQLVEDDEQPNQVVPLTFREACNKIIHSLYIDFDLKEPISPYPNAALNPVVYLNGRKSGKRWTAKLDVYRFAHGATRVA